MIFAYVAYRRHKRKRLSYEIISNTPLLSVKSEVKGRIKIYLDDRPVEDVNLIMIRITNIGNDPILSKDLTTPITINFDEAAKLLSVEIFERIPVDMLLPDMALSNNWIALSPQLLNEKDSITIKILGSGVTSAPIVRARIAGVEKIENITGRLNRSRGLLNSLLHVFRKSN